ncbi:hypothetical protein KNT64_gp201 [Pseudomonas phage PspYZU05]|uniref:Uncharacterized protein n=1 Tax=Pseudomonas phage PspYZU05 TaxID=1983556 RepID=A0A2U7N8F1_9CAUD|nr:hypothetical protein KNT64_gp201 [Pseudomonas phage PspYZU05]ASD52153.1 hypothetical protein PspYZU05_201 [Pseudomonas phage PspYZU05]
MKLHGLTNQQYAKFINSYTQGFGRTRLAEEFDLPVKKVKRIINHSRRASRKRLLSAFIQVKKTVLDKKAFHGICSLVNDETFFIIQYQTESLLSLKAKDQFNAFKYIGSISYNLRLVDKIVMNELFTKWPKHSGNILFPVPPPHNNTIEESEHPMGAYEAFSTCHLWEGEYGELRKELLDFCIGYLENLC